MGILYCRVKVIKNTYNICREIFRGVGYLLFFYFGLAIFLNVRSVALDPKGILKARRAAASGEKNNSLYKVSLRLEGAYYKTCGDLLSGFGAEHPIIF